MNNNDLHHLSQAELIDQIHTLNQQLAEAKEARDDAELLADTITEHATELENQLYRQNTTMSSYIQQVGKIIEAAIAVENNTFSAEHLQDVLPRTDELGLLARVFHQMVDTVKARESQIAQAKNQLEAVLNAVPGSIAWINRQGVYIGVNRHLASLVGLGLNEIINQEVGFSGTSPEFEQFVEQFLTSDLDSTSQELPVRIEGKIQHYLLVAQKYDAGQGVVLVGIDISERRAAERELAQQRNQFARFVPMEYLQFLRRDSLVNVELGEHVSLNMAMMFSDIRAFTTLAERMSPQDSFNFVNHYLSMVAPAIRDRGGFIVKYMGDGIMAAFPSSADDAVAGGIAHLEQVQAFNAAQARPDQIDIGIGIHFGHVMVGIVGESGRMQGDAFSDSVNLAARLEGLTKVYGVSLLISEAVLEQLSTPIPYHIRFIDRAVVKGRHEAIEVYEVFDGEPEAIRQLKHETQNDFELAISCYAEGNLADALIYFDRVLERNPDDRPAKMYYQRVELLLQQGLPDAWDGTWQFTAK